MEVFFKRKYEKFNTVYHKDHNNLPVLVNKKTNEEEIDIWSGDLNVVTGRISGTAKHPMFDYLKSSNTEENFVKEFGNPMCTVHLERITLVVEGDDTKVSIKLFQYMKHYETNLKQKSSDIFLCKTCDYSTSRKSQYERHLLTSKHFLKQNGTNQTNLNNQIYICKCGHSFNSRTTLWRHKKNTQCKSKKHNTNHIIIENKDTQQLTELVMKVVEQNQELTKQIIELSKTSNNSISNSTVNSHNKFNLNVYLNETCKNAINISDFVSSLIVSVNDLEDTSRLGYVEGVSNIFLNGLKQLDVHDRPVHCADQKREILYIKDNNEWTKDTDDKAVLTKAIKQVAHKNIKKISEWQKLNPEYNDPESKQNDKYQKILLNAMSGSTKEESDKNYEKIIKNVVKNTVIIK